MYVGYGECLGAFGSGVCGFQDFRPRQFEVDGYQSPHIDSNIP